MEVENVEGEKGKTSTKKCCHTQPPKGWKLRRPKTCVHPGVGACKGEGGGGGGGRFVRTSNGQAWDIVSSSTNDLVG